MTISWVGLMDHIRDHTPKREVVLRLHLHPGILRIGRDKVEFSLGRFLYILNIKLPIDKADRYIIVIEFQRTIYNDDIPS